MDTLSAAVGTTPPDHVAGELQRPPGATQAMSASGAYAEVPNAWPRRRSRPLGSIAGALGAGWACTGRVFVDRRAARKDSLERAEAGCWTCAERTAWTAAEDRMEPVLAPACPVETTPTATSTKKTDRPSRFRPSARSDDKVTLPYSPRSFTGITTFLACLSRAAARESDQLQRERGAPIGAPLVSLVFVLTSAGRPRA